MRLLLATLLAATGSLPTGCGNSAIPSITDGSGARDFAIAGGSDGSSAPDLATADVDLSTAPVDARGANTFPDAIAGIWLIGWSGGLEHYSWVRFTGVMGGTVDVLEPMGNAAWTAYWPNCAGKGGTWAETQKPSTIQITLPQACNGQSSVLTFNQFLPPNGFPAGAILDAKITTNPATMPLGGWKFPPSQCDANFTTCTLPM